MKNQVKNYVKIREGLRHSLPFQHGGKKCRSCSCVNSLVSFRFHSASFERQLPKLRRKGYSCQCITHFGSCMKRKPRENIQVCVSVLPTSYRQVTDTLPTVGQLLTDCRPTGSLCFGQNLLAVCRRQTADSRPTVGRQTTGQQTTNSGSTDGRQSADRFFGELFFTITKSFVDSCSCKRHVFW